MSQSKTNLNNETAQPKLTELWNTPKPQRGNIGHKPRSRSVKRKHQVISPTSDITEENKRQNKRKMATENSGATPSPTPDKLKQREPDELALSKLDQSVVAAIKLLLQPIRDDVKDLISSHKEMRETISEVTKLREENVILQQRVETVERKNQKLTDRINTLENRLLETSIVISGIQESPWETEAVRQEKLFIAFAETIIGRTLDDRLDTTRSMYIKGTRRIGNYRTMQTRPIIVEFMYKADAEYILNNKKYLGEGVYADQAYCKETKDARRILRPYLKAARRKPNYQRRCKLEGGTLIIKGLSYTVDDLDKLPADLSGFNISSTTDETSFGYFGYMNPFSNFHTTRFNLNGIDYHCGEQFIQHSKAKFFNNEDVAKKILNCGTASGCKRLAREITNYDNDMWKRTAKENCLPGIRAKFVQNPVLQNMLLETGDKTIVECCADPVWGNGIPLNDENCLDKRRWSGQGLMGEMLEEVRDYLRRSTTITAESVTSVEPMESDHTGAISTTEENNPVQNRS